MNNDYLVSIIIPVYNVEQYMDDCLTSAEKQTYKNLEIIVVDDCGTDKSIQIAKKHAAKDSRIKIIYQPHNMGQGAGRNRAIDNATGDYIIFLDADDTMPLDSVELLLNRIIETNADMVLGRLLWNKEHKCFPVAYIDTLIDGYLCETGKLRNISAQKYMLSGPVAKIFNTKWLNTHNVRFAEGCFWEDMLFTLIAWVESDNIAVLNNYVYFRTERNDESNPSTTQAYGKKKYLDRDRIFDYFCEYLSKKQKEKAVTSEDCRITMSRLMSTTKTLVPMADADIQDWANEWYIAHLDRCNAELEKYGWLR